VTDKLDKEEKEMIKTIGFIGCGNMGGAIAKAVAKKDVTLMLSDSFKEKAEDLANEIGGKVSNNTEIAKNADLIFLGVKPQVLSSTICEIKDIIKDETIVISMAAGVNTDKIKGFFGREIKLIRIMPNTPVSVGKGMILYSPTESVLKEEVSAFEDIMSEAGRLDRIAEGLIDAGSALSGCGPAFVFMFIEALADGGVAAGLPRDKALIYATETLIGSAELLKTSGKHPEELKDAVCSPAGSTIEGVKTLENGGMRGTVMTAISNAFNRTKELGK
jgi:pyrroline-5-carboxylate reductase